MFQQNRNKILVVFSLVVLFIAGVIYDSARVPEVITIEKKIEDLVEIKKVPDVEFEKIDGSKIKLHDLKGKVYLINFWASWCPPCIKEFPSMLEMLDKTNGKVQLLAVSNDIDIPTIRKFLQKYKFQQNIEFSHSNLHIIFDKGRDITQDIFNTSRYPETIIVSPNGDMVRKVVGGDMNWSSEESLKYLTQLLEEKP